MSVKIDKQVFLVALATVSSVIKNKTTIPSLSTVHMVANQGLCWLTATDMDCYFSKAVKVKGEGGFTCLLPSRLIREWLSNIGNGELEIRFEDRRLLMFIGTHKFSTPTMAVTEFPSIPAATGKKVVEANFSALEHVMCAAPTDESRIELWDIPIQRDGDTGKLVACSANGRFFATHAFDGKADPGSVIHITPPMAYHISKLGKCSVVENERFFIYSGEDFHFHNKRLSVKVIDFLKQMRAWQFNVGSATVIREDLIEGVAACHALRDEESGLAQVLITAAPGGVRVNCQNDIGNEDHFVGGNVSDGFGQAILPSDNLLKALTQSKEDVVTIHRSEATNRLEAGDSNYYFAGFRPK